jgi:hypothetical protein
MIEIKKLEPKLEDDYFLFFDEIAFADHPEWGCECYCCFFHAESQQAWEKVTAEQNKETARAMIMAGQLQGVLAYVDGRPAAWCHYDSKSKLPGLGVFYPELVDHAAQDDSVAAIVCFTVAQGNRGQGLAGLLLEAACADLASQGYLSVEAYPAEAGESPEHQYHGPLSMYLSHGFTIAMQLPKNAIVRKKLQKHPESPV